MESNSITNQKQILLDYAKNMGICPGYSLWTMKFSGQLFKDRTFSGCREWWKMERSGLLSQRMFLRSWAGQDVHADADDLSVSWRYLYCHTGKHPFHDRRGNAALLQHIQRVSGMRCRRARKSVQSLIWKSHRADGFLLPLPMNTRR